MSKSPQVFYEAGRQFTKLCWLALVLIPLGVMMMGGAVYVAYDLRAVDGTLEPLGTRITLAALLGITGALCTFGMWLYLSIYPVRLLRTDDRRSVVIETSRLLALKRRTVPANHLGETSFHTGQMGMPGSLEARAGFRHTINTPFHTLWIKGWHLPLILDGQADLFDHDELARMRRATTNA